MWDSRFLTLRASAAKVFAVAWQRNVAKLLEERGLDQANAQPVLEEAHKLTIDQSSSLPVRNQEYRMITLHCAVLLLACYHPYGSSIVKAVPHGWTDKVWDRYLRLLKRHGLSYAIP